MLGLVPALGAVASGNEISALVPAGTSASLGDHCGPVRLIEQPRLGPRHLWRLLDDLHRLPALARRLDADVLFSITDLGPPDPGCPHVMLLHNPWVTYRLPRRQIGRSLRDQLIYATYYPLRFRRLWPRLARIIVQTPVMGDRLRARFGVPAERIAVIPPGCLLGPGAGEPRHAPVTPAVPLRLFWPARGYPHKNHTVLPRLCRELVRRGLGRSVRVFVTLDAGTDRRTRRVLRELGPYADIVTNLGPLTKTEVERSFDETDALFLPTLLESYSLTYLEAAARRRPVLTSDRDFARHACGRAGYYFDPENPVDICDRIVDLMQDIERGAPRVPPPPTGERGGTSWEAVARHVLAVLEEAAAAGTRRRHVTCGTAAAHTPVMYGDAR